MKWATVKWTHINTNNVTAFKWKDGLLYVFFIAEEEPTHWHDPDRELYLKLCRQQGVQPYGED